MSERSFLTPAVLLQMSDVVHALQREIERLEAMPAFSPTEHMERQGGIRLMDETASALAEVQAWWGLAADKHR